MKLAKGEACSGCAVCVDACPFDAITMVADTKGFLHPSISPLKCKQCGRCTQACPSLHREPPRLPIEVYAAKSKDEELRINSSSGGVFSILARMVIGSGGVVYGAAFEGKDWGVRHISIDNISEVVRLQGSKYVQSYMVGVYRKVRDLLRKDVPVLFSGTPCQVAALKRFVGNNCSNLYLVDVVCHGVPSPAVWTRYLSSRFMDSKITSISFRRKDRGWKNYALSIGYENGTEYFGTNSEDAFLRAFLNDLCNRSSCHACRWRGLRSGSDLTIADCWGVERFMPEMYDERGVSLLLVNSERGRAAKEAILPYVECASLTFRDAVEGNPAIVRDSRPHLLREKFFCRFRSDGFDSLVSMCLRLPLKFRIRRVVGKLLRKAGLRK